MTGRAVARWGWGPGKARRNLLSHKVSFELAERIFGDPMIATKADPYPHEERWQSIGRPSANSGVTVLVVHTDPAPQSDGGEVGRIISARRATSHERRAYEEGQF